jgi:hypothetical protein
VLYGLIEPLLNQVMGKPAEEVEQLRIQVLDAPKPTRVALPMFVDIGEPKEKP